MGKPVGTRCVQKFNCKWLGPGQMTSFYTLSDILRAILSGDKEVCCVIFVFEWRVTLKGLDRRICLELICIDGLNGAIASADRVTFGERFFLTSSFVILLVHSVPPLFLCVEKVTQKYLCVFQKVPKNACFWACVRISTQILLFFGKSGKARIQCLCGFPDFLISIITHPQK